MTARLAALVVALALAACGSTDAERPGAGRGPGPGPACDAMAEMCPMDIEGAKVAFVESPDGPALDFTTTGDVAELRRRVAYRASVHDQMPCAGKAEPRGGGVGRFQPPASSVTASDIEGGARLVFRPETPAELDALRAFVRKRAVQIQSGACRLRAGG